MLYQRAFREELRILSSLSNRPICVLCHNFFEPSEVQTCSAPQNDCLNLSFVKGIHVDSKKMARNGRRTAIYCFNRTQQSDEEIQILINYCAQIESNGYLFTDINII